MESAFALLVKVICLYIGDGDVDVFPSQFNLHEKVTLFIKTIMQID